MIWRPVSDRLRSALIQVPEAVKPGGEPLRVPVRTDALIADLKRALADLTVAPLDDESTWFALKAAPGN